MLDAKAEIIIKDDGSGMTFENCQDFYLNVGWGRRADNPDRTSPGGRPMLGRKGIGKFAGFDIAKLVRIATVSAPLGSAMFRNT
jgi:HSP90 family molecular chaperone